MNNDFTKENLEKFYASIRRQDKEPKECTLEQFSTTQLKAELRRRKNKPNKKYRSDY